MVPVEVTAAVLAFGCDAGTHTPIDRAVCTATGPAGLLITAAYSFLVAFALPLPSEVVLAPAGDLRLGLPTAVDYALVIVVSGLGKAAGSVVAFHVGNRASHSGPVLGFLRRSCVDVVEWSERRAVELARQYGYAGLALALSVPGFPDTVSIYAFSVLEDDYLKFAAATFAGSVGRLVLVATVVRGAVAVF